MKSVQFAKTGIPEEVLQVVETTLREPNAGEVRVKMKACSINPSDLMYVNGLYGLSADLPAVGGFEGTGVIDKVGEGVELPVGMRVAFISAGTWQEYVIAPAKVLVPIPDSMNDATACQAFVNPMTAHAMLEESGLKAGDWLMLTAGASAFGKFVVQMCKERGIQTVCTVRRDTHVSLLKGIGATAVINTETEHIGRSVKRITNGKGVDYVFEAVAGRLGSRALYCLKPGGTMLVYGALSLEDIAVGGGLLIFRNLTIKGFWLTTWMRMQTGATLRKAIGHVFEQLSSDNLNAAVEASYPIDAIQEAVRHSALPGRQGKIILTF